MPGGPGNLSWQMPPRPDDLLRKQKDQSRTQREQAAGNILQGAQVGAGGILINNGGSLTIAGTGTFNTNGTITTTSSFSAGTSINAGTTITAGGALSGASLNVGSGGVSGGAFSGSSLSCSGNITSTGGAVYSSSAFQSPGSRALVVTVGYVNAYLDTNGFLGYQPSTRRVKKDLGSIPGWLLDATLRLPTYMGRYRTEDSTAPRTPFLIAEDVRDAGFGPSVVPLDENGEPAAINTQNLFPVLLELIKRQQKQIDALTAKVDALTRAAN